MLKDTLGKIMNRRLIIAILKQMTVSTMTSVEISSIAGQQTAHDNGNRCQACFQQQMDMIGDQSPGVNWCFSFGKDITESFDKLIAILVVFKDFAFLDPSNDDVVKRSGGIYACFTRHKSSLTPLKVLVNLFIYLWASPCYFLRFLT